MKDVSFQLENFCKRIFSVLWLFLVFIPYEQKSIILILSYEKKQNNKEKFGFKQQVFKTDSFRSYFTSWFVLKVLTFKFKYIMYIYNVSS